MIPLSQLSKATREALAFLKVQPDVAEAEVFAAWNGNLTVRLNYTSRIPSNAVEEPKSVDSYGLGIRTAFNTPEGLKNRLWQRALRPLHRGREAGPGHGALRRRPRL